MASTQTELAQPDRPPLSPNLSPLSPLPPPGISKALAKCEEVLRPQLPSKEQPLALRLAPTPV